VDIDGVSVWMQGADGRRTEKVDFKDAVGFELHPTGAIQVLGVITEMNQRAMPEKRAFPLKTLAPGSWYSVELMNPKASKASPLILARPDIPKDILN
jgi:hypothetical protein